MPTIVMKEAPDVDYYVAWSSVVEAPVFAGTREEVLWQLRRDLDPWLSTDAPHHPERRLERADKTGTTSVWIEGAGMRDQYPEQGSWEDVGGEIFMQRGMCSRANIFRLARRWADDGNADVTDLLTPFDDADEVRPA